MQQSHIGASLTVATPVVPALRVQAVDITDPVAMVSRGPSVADYAGAWEDRGGTLNGSAPAVGKHFVSVRFGFANVSESGVNNARVFLYLVDTNEALFAPNIDVVPGCRSYVQWGFDLRPAEAVTECAVFQIPNSVTVSQVRLGETVDSSGRVVTMAEWSLTP